MALYLKATQPDLGIENVYQLDDEQFQAAVDLLKQQRQAVGKNWSLYTDADTANSCPATVSSGRRGRSSRTS